MNIITHLTALYKDKCFRLKILLLSGWTFGLVLGLRFAVCSPEYVSDMMRSLLNRRMSFAGGLLSLTFPLVITAFMLLYHKDILLPVLAFCKAFTFGFASGCIYLAFGSAAWLLRSFLCFTAIFSNVCLLFLWLSAASREKSEVNRCYVCTIAFMAVIFVLDYFAVSPYLMMLLNY